MIVKERRIQKKIYTYTTMHQLYDTKHDTRTRIPTRTNMRAYERAKVTLTVKVVHFRKIYTVSFIVQQTGTLYRNICIFGKFLKKITLLSFLKQTCKEMFLYGKFIVIIFAPSTYHRFPMFYIPK